MKRFTTWAAIASLLASGAVGCGGAAGTGPGGNVVIDKVTGKPVVDSKGNVISVDAVNKFKTGLEAMAQHDKANDWNDAACDATAEMFLDAATEQGDKEFSEAFDNCNRASHVMLCWSCQSSSSVWF